MKIIIGKRRDRIAAAQTREIRDAVATGPGLNERYDAESAEGRQGIGHGIVTNEAKNFDVVRQDYPAADTPHVRWLNTPAKTGGHALDDGGQVPSTIEAAASMARTGTQAREICVARAASFRALEPKHHDFSKDEENSPPWNRKR